jgi:hypothetical protein
MYKTIIVDLNDVTKAIGFINLARKKGTALDKLRFSDYDCIGNCGWAKAPNAWYLHFKISNKAWTKALQIMADNKLQLLPETTGY